MQFESTKNIVPARTMLIYGDKGSGKSRLFQGAVEAGMKVAVADLDRGLSSCNSVDIPHRKISTIAEFKQWVDWVCSPASHSYHLLGIDDLTSLSKMVFYEIKPKYKNKQQAYGDMADMIRKWLVQLRDCNFPGYQVNTCKLGKIKCGVTGAFHFGPSFEGQKLEGDIKFIYDEVWYLNSSTNDQGQFVNYFRTQRDEQIVAGSRSDKLEMWEPASLPYIIQKLSS